MSILESLLLGLDIVYGIFFLLFYIFVGCVVYVVFLFNDMWMFYCVLKDEDYLLVIGNERIVYRFVFRYF